MAFRGCGSFGSVNPKFAGTFSGVNPVGGVCGATEARSPDEVGAGISVAIQLIGGRRTGAETTADTSGSSPQRCTTPLTEQEKVKDKDSGARTAICRTLTTSSPVSRAGLPLTPVGGVHNRSHPQPTAGVDSTNRCQNRGGLGGISGGGGSGEATMWRGCGSFGGGRLNPAMLN
jgi:hypothetical protein